MAMWRKRAFDVPPEDVDRSVFIYCDPDERPYEYKDFREIWKHLQVDDKISSFYPIKYTNAWLLKLKTPEAKQVLLKVDGISVKQVYCKIQDSAMPEHLITVHWVPMSMTDLTPIRLVFEEYGLVSCVRRVVRPVLNVGDIEFTSVKVTMTLWKGVTERDMPYELHLNGVSHLVVVPGRPPFCLKCRSRGHTFISCNTPKCAKCGRWGHKHHKAHHGPV
ncbi:hypothetical protein HPB52_000411 [Rhipicephalus sanguineus]|uniref:Uncharacterized protein n=1 Tax=Rhipicephalus sanguineus TaxID=34632 RepID=A0A9D4QFX6_RHISA|nr:hypothetical protein HPB52_000411 [Rhipicephalus sanguineus]